MLFCYFFGGVLFSLFSDDVEPVEKGSPQEFAQAIADACARKDRKVEREKILPLHAWVAAFQVCRVMSVSFVRTAYCYLLRCSRMG